MPELSNLVDEIEDDEDTLIERECLLLPSDLVSTTVRKKFGLNVKDNPKFWRQFQRHGTIEYQLRVGQANEAIGLICSIIEHGMLLRQVKRQAHGVNLGLRSMKYVNSAVDKKRKYAADYAHARRCILRLLARATHPDYPPLSDSDMWAKNAAMPHQLGDGSKTESWIWTYGLLKNLSVVERNNFLDEGG